MTEFDGDAYECEQNRRLQEVSARLREFVELDLGFGPVVEFLCPRGHSLKRYRAYERDERLFLQALPGDAPKAGPSASNGSPWTGTRKLCDDVSGCRTPIEYEGTCAEHGGRRSEAVHGTRTRFACRRCGWSDVFTTSRLIQIYGLAVHMELDRIPVTGSHSSARRGT